jgi:hypothetical protein
MTRGAAAQVVGVDLRLVETVRGGNQQAAKGTKRQETHGKQGMMLCDTERLISCVRYVYDLLECQIRWVVKICVKTSS